MRPLLAISVAVGAVVGAAARWGVGTLSWSGAFPIPTLVVNVVGAGLLGIVLASQHRHRAWWFSDAAGAGFCGGFTTMSTVAVQAAGLLRTGDAPLAALYLLGTVVLGVGAGAVGWRAGRPSTGRPLDGTAP